MITFNFTLTDADAENLVSILNDAVVAAMMEVMDAMASGQPTGLLRLMALANDVNGSTKVQMNDGCVSVVFYFSEFRAGNRDVLEDETIAVTVSDVTGFYDKLRCETEFENAVSTIKYRERILQEIEARRALARQTWENLTVEQREALGLEHCPE